MSILKLMDRPIAFQRAFVRLGVGITGALMLSQAVYWANRTNNKDGWFYKGRDEWEEETGLTRREQEKARRSLKAIGVLEEKLKGVPARLYYRVNDDELERVLLGDRREITLDEVLSLYTSALNGLSKTGMMRAKKAGVAVEYVDYAGVLKAKGMVCGICGKAITTGPGRAGEALVFDHIAPLLNGGEHRFNNLQPAHAHCNLTKTDRAEPLADTQLGYTKPTGLLTQSQQDGLHKASKEASPKPAITEITTETTTEIKNPCSSGKPDLVQQVFNHWVEVMGKNPNVTKLAAKRKTKIEKALKLYGIEEIKQAIEGCRLTPFNMGENEQGKAFNDIELILRNEVNVERFIEAAKNPPKPSSKRAKHHGLDQWSGQGLNTNGNGRKTL